MGELNVGPTMFHYLLEMHKDGKSIMQLEMNVPIEVFPTVKMNLLLALETMLVEYGKSQGFVRKGQADLQVREMLAAGGT
mgnify:CR=1 FL=1